MHLTLAADYGVRVMIHLASLPEGSTVAAGELAAATGASDAFLTKILQKLVNAGLAASRRGNRGGFSLAAPAGRISMLDVVEAVDGPIHLNVCTGRCGYQHRTCTRQNWCAAHLVWAEAQAKLLHTLRSASLERLAKDTTERRKAYEQRIETLPA